MAKKQNKPKYKPKYKNPPLVEVFCELYFENADGQAWDSFLVPQFYEKIKVQYPTRKKLSTVGLELRMPSGPQGLRVKAQGPSTPRTQFLSEDSKSIVQVGENLLVVNQLPPYYGWEKFEPKVMHGFKNYVALWKPDTIGRLALHYIDKVVIPEDQFDISEYFNLYPVLPAGGEDAITNLAMAFEITGATEGDILAIAFKQHPAATPDSTAFLFQFDYVATESQPVTAKEVQQWLSAAHDFTGRYFESVLTEKCKQLFK